MVAKFDNRPKPEKGAGDPTFGLGGDVLDPGPDAYGTGIPGAANKDAVKFNYFTGLKGTADRYETTGSGRYETDRDANTIVFEAQKYLGNLRAKAGASNASTADKEAYEDFVAALRRYKGGEPFETTSGEDTAWTTVLKDAAGTGVNALDLLRNAGSSGGTDGFDGGGLRAYTGPTSTTTLMNERDLRSTADAVASTVIGRGITDDEFKKILKQVRTAERAEPSVSVPGVGSSVSMPGISAEGRQDVIREALMKGPEAKDYSKATTMMDVFYKALESRPEGA